MKRRFERVGCTGAAFGFGFLTEVEPEPEPDTCPNCGNRNPETIQSNGEPHDSPDLTLLCAGPIQDVDGESLVVCGHQWNPNDKA